MTRTLSISDLICNGCGADYDTIEEVTECEMLDAAEAEADAYEQDFWDEHFAAVEQDHWEADDAYLTSLHQIR